jgi:hypothetical protein
MLAATQTPARRPPRVRRAAKKPSEDPMKRIVSSFAVLACFAGLAALGNGCSSSSGGGGGGTTVTADEAAQQAATAFCAKLNECSSFALVGTYGDLTTCAARFKIEFLSRLAATGTGVKPQNYADCASAIGGVTCGALYASTLPASCQPVAGSVAKGGACFDHSQCATKFCGIDASKGICGVCADPPAAEAACASGDCPDGLYCAADSKCRAYVAEGGTCDANHTCSTTLVCFSGKCAKPGAVGDACGTGKAACNSTIGLYCNTKTSKCAQATESVAAGGACGVNATTGAIEVCDGKSFCKITDTTKYTGTCTAKVADGGTCDATNALTSPCTIPATCKAGKCTLPDTSTCK